jgi:hypothetical protein
MVHDKAAGNWCSSNQVMQLKTRRSRHAVRGSTFGNRMRRTTDLSIQPIEPARHIAQHVSTGVRIARKE